MLSNPMHSAGQQFHVVRCHCLFEELQCPFGLSTETHSQFTQIFQAYQLARQRVELEMALHRDAKMCGSVQSRLADREEEACEIHRIQTQEVGTVEHALSFVSDKTASLDDGKDRDLG